MSKWNEGHYNVILLLFLSIINQWNIMHTISDYREKCNTNEIFILINQQHVTLWVKNPTQQ